MHTRLAPTLGRRRARGGFSLLEVLLAAAILGATVVALLLVLTQTGARGADADDLRRLDLLAAELLREQIDEQRERASGELPAPYDGWRWTYSRREEPWDAGDEQVPLIRHELQLKGPGELQPAPLVTYTADVEEGLDAVSEEGEGEGADRSPGGG